MLKKIEAKADNFNSLQYMIGPQNSQSIKFLTYDQLSTYKSLDSLVSNGDCVIILFEIENGKKGNIGHFIALLDHGNHIEHFDSYGLDIDEELLLSQEHHLTRLFQDSNKKVINNTTQLQAFKGDINTCGKWVVARVLLREYELHDFINLVTFFKSHYDDTITILTFLLNYKN